MPLTSRYPDIVIPEVSLTEYIFRALYRQPNRVAIIEASTGREVTFGDIAAATVKCASAFYRKGLRKGDIVAIIASNSVEYAVAILAIAACGAAITLCNPLYTEDEMKYQLQQTKPKFVITVPLCYQKVKAIEKSVKSIQIVFNIGLPDEVDSFEKFIANDDGSAFPRNVQIDPREDVLFLPYSSGTTGLPKGVMLTHYGFVSSLVLCKIQPGFITDTHYVILPMFHIYGLLIVYVALDHSVRSVLDVRFDLETMLQAWEKYKVTRCASVPPILLILAKSPLLRKYDLSSMLLIGSGAAPLPPDVGRVLNKELNCKVLQGWGLTEFLPITVSDTLVTPFHSVGSVAPNTKLKVINVETGRELGEGESGELCVKGPQMMKGYYNNPTATSNTIDVDGWMHTGDIGYYDHAGHIYIMDRLKELIKYKGFQVAPAELEAVLISHPRILDAAVIGVPDSKAGEVAKAFVIPRDSSLTKEEIHKFLEGKVSKYKYLYGGIEFRDVIEKSQSGKILRRVLREQEAAKSKL